MLQKNQSIEIDVTGMTSECQGVGKTDGFAVFVPFALPRERVLAHVIKVGKTFAVAKLTSVLTPSPKRIEPPCAAFGKCGGCALQHLEYAEQLEVKRTQVVDALERIGGIADAGALVLPTIGMDDPLRYRNKGAFPASSDGGVKLGLYAHSSHRVVPVDDCILQKAECIQVMRAVRQWAEQNAVPAYDEASHRGILRHAMARTTQDGQTMAIVITNGALPKKDELIALLTQNVRNLVSIVHNMNNAKTNVIMGKQSACIWGEPVLSDELCGLRFEVSAESFLQVNAIQAQKLYEKALEFAALDQTQTAADIYCGIGTISLLLAQRAKSVTGIEIVPEAIENARQNAKRNAIFNADFICAPAEAALPALAAKGATFDLITLDPPRKGCDPALLDAIIAIKPQKLVYISCNPATLARDLKTLTQNGYTLTQAQPVDMFAFTPHVEVVVSICRKDT